MALSEDTAIYRTAYRLLDILPLIIEANRAHIARRAVGGLLYQSQEHAEHRQCHQV